MIRHRSAARLWTVVVAGVVAVALFSGVAVADGPAEVDLENLGSGTEANPYVITNASELQAMNQSLGAAYELGRTINATNSSGWNGGNGFSPVGNASHPFTGSFDGNGYTVENLTVNRGDEDYVGLFGNASKESKIGNVTLRNAIVTGRAHIGTLVGESNGEIYEVDASGLVTTELDELSNINDGDGSRTGGVVGMLNQSGTVTNVTASVKVNATINNHATRLGGLVGYSNGEIRDSKATGDVEGLNGIGGLIGRNVGHIENATATGNVTGLSGGFAFGGLAGYNGRDVTDPGTITRSHATGTVSAVDANNVGGLIGTNILSVNTSYAAGTVEGDDNVGGLVGRNSESVSRVNESYATGNVSGDTDVGGFVGYNRNGAQVRESYANGDVSGTTNDIGGFVGYHETGTIADSYADGTVSGTTSNIGGFVGFNDATIERSYAVGEVPEPDGHGTPGGLVGSTGPNAEVTDSYWDTDAAGEDYSAGGTGLSSFEMTALVATDYMAFDFAGTWNATDRYPRLAWEGVDEPNPYPEAVPGAGEVWLTKSTGDGKYHNYSLDGGNVRWLGEVIMLRGDEENTAEVIKYAAEDATADYDTIVVGPGTYNLTNIQIDLTADGAGNVTRLFSHEGSDTTEIIRGENTKFNSYDFAILRVDDPDASELTIGDSGVYDVDSNAGFYIESTEGGTEDPPLIGVYDAASQYNLTVRNTTFGMWTNQGSNILLRDANTAFDLEIDLVSHSGAVINASAASSLSVTNSTITEENDPRNSGLGGEGISFLKLESNVLDTVRVENVTIAGATEANEVNGVIDITSLATDAAVTVEDLEIRNTSQDAIALATEIDSLSLSGLNLTDIGKRGLTISDTVGSVTIADSDLRNTSATSFYTSTTASVSQYTITETTITDSSGRGIFLEGAVGNATIENNTLTDSELTPIEFDVNAGQSTPYEIRDNHVDGSGDGNTLIVIRQPAQVNITNNTLLNSSFRGIYLDASDSVIENTEIENTSAGGQGIHLEANADDAYIANTTVTDSAGRGIHLDGADSATIHNVTVETAGTYGIEFAGGTTHELTDSTVSKTGFDALRVGSTTVAVTGLELTSGTVSADVTDANLNTTTVPTGPADYQSGEDAVEITRNANTVANFALGYDTTAFEIDQRALALWRYGTDWSRQDSTVETETQTVAATGSITDTGVLTTFASDVSITAADTTADAGATGTIDLTATNASGTALENVELNVTDDGGLGGLSVGDTATTNASGVANISFQEPTNGTYTVEVSWTNDTTVTDTATVTVESGAADRIELDPGDSREITAGETIDFNATAFDAAGNQNETVDTEFTWQNSTANGTFDTTTVGEYTVSVTLGSATNSTVVTVTPAAVDGLELDPGTAQEITAGETIDFNATALDEYGNENETVDTAFTWENTTTNGTFDTTTSGEYTVSVAFAGQTNATRVTVAPGAVSRVTLDPGADQEITAGEAVAFSATAFDEFGNENQTTDTAFTWANATTDGTFDNTTAGDYTVSATLAGVTNATGVTVDPAAVSRITLDPGADQEITAGETIDVNATAVDAFGNPNETVDTAFTWENTTANGTFDNTTSGEYTVSAAFAGETNATKITVTPGAVSRVGLDPGADQEITAGETIDFSATAVDAFGNQNETVDTAFTWQNATTNGTFNNTTAGVYAVSAELNGVTNATTVTVSSAAVGRVTLDPGADQEITAGETIDFSATAVDAFGNQNETVDTAFTWENTTTNGTFNNTTGGNYTVSAAVDGETNSTRVTVTPAAVGRVTLDPAGDQEITTGGTIEFNATALDAFGNPNETVDTAFTWQNTTTSGLFNNTSVGDYTVSAAFAGVTNTTTVRVEAVRRSSGSSGSSGGGGPPVQEDTGTTVTVGGTTEADGGTDDGESDGSTADGRADDSDTRVRVSNPEPGQRLVIQGDGAYITDGDTETDSPDDSDIGGSDDTDTGGSDDTDTDGSDGTTSDDGDGSDDGETDADESKNVRSDRLSVDINTDRDFELSVTTYETDLTRSRSRTAQSSIRPFASGVALVGPASMIQETRVPDEVRAAATSFEGETGTVSAGYVDIDHTLGPGEISGATFEFSIRQAYLNELGVDAGNVTLYHRTDGEWVSRETTLTGTDATHYRFEGTMPEFSVFALGTGAAPVDVTEASLSASTIQTGDTATVSTTVTNRGQTAAEETIDLTVDGEVISSETVSLDGGATSEISLEYSPTAAGEYSLAVGGVDAGTLSVDESDGQPWWLVVVLLVVVTVLIVFWRRRDDR